MNKTLKNKAFTLIEVLVVTSVIALLASITTSSMSQAREEAQDKKKVQESKQVDNAIAIHRTKTNTAPIGTISSSYVAYNEKSNEYQSAMQELVDNGSMPQIPRSDTGKDYYYLIDDSGNGVFGAVLRSDSEIQKNNGCYFTDPDVGCSGENASYVIEFDRGTLIAEGDSCDGTCDGVSENSDGIIWDYQYFSELSYDQTSVACGIVNTENMSDWRVPTISELQDEIASNNSDFYTVEGNEFYWSSTNNVAVSVITNQTETFTISDTNMLRCVRP